MRVLHRCTDATDEGLKIAANLIMKALHYGVTYRGLHRHKALMPYSRPMKAILYCLIRPRHQASVGACKTLAAHCSACRGRNICCNRRVRFGLGFGHMTTQEETLTEAGKM